MSCSQKYVSVAEQYGESLLILWSHVDIKSKERMASSNISASTKNVGREIKAKMEALANEAEARHLMRFFKTGKGQYGEGDLFLGIRVPVTHSIVKEYRHIVEIEDVDELVASKYHEVRLAGFLLLIEIYLLAKKNKDADDQRHIADYYLSIIPRGNNWDLVDLVAPKIFGDWLVDHPDKRNILDSLADMDGKLWHQRVAIVTTLALICNGEYDDTLRIARRLLNHPHDLIHKASGWMLREVGKRGGKDRLLEFLDRHAATMPRTMLRYAIEHFSPEERRHYLDM